MRNEIGLERARIINQLVSEVKPAAKKANK
jgi:hypothetical protein